MARYLFIASHVDDIEISAGGFLIRQLSLGHECTVISLSSEYAGVSLLHEWVESMRVLQPDNYEIHDFPTRDFQLYRQQILDVLLNYKDYDYVVTHSAKSFHQDHKVVGEESIRAFKNTNLITYIHEWDTRTSSKNYFIELFRDNVEKKIQALECYKSQVHRPYMNKDYIWANALNNGAICGTKYAEAFEVINFIE